ncbi:MAG: DUF2892 domain-containing protein [Acidobacteria bacterium]|nr:DUF2892 domain-containing protein [Acidobacteriota bacterium]
MNFQPNMGGLHRVIYAVCGVGMMAWGFFVSEAAWAKIALPILGAGALLEGLIAY